MKTIENIEHEGEIVSITDTKIEVRIHAQSACATCHAKSVCAAGDMKEKIIEITHSAAYANYKIGDIVMVGMTQKMGMKAILYGFFFPLVVMVCIAFAGMGMGISETLTAILALLSVAIYYFAIYLCRNKIGRQFDFYIRGKMPEPK